MEISKLINFTNYDIYYISSKEFSYYISIPKNKNINYHMAMDLDKYIDILSLDIDKINVTIKDIYKDLNDCSVILIIPNIDSSLLNFKEIEKDYLILGKKVVAILNDAYKLLVKNNINTNNSIYFLDDEKYNNFIAWFKNKFIGRVEHISILKILKEYNMSRQGYVSNNDIKKININGLNFIIGRENEQIIQPVLEIENPYQEYNKMIEEEQKEFKQPSMVMGNISYLLLGTLCVIISIILLILLIKK